MNRILQGRQTAIYVTLVMASHDPLVDEYVDEVLQLRRPDRPVGMPSRRARDLELGGKKRCRQSVLGPELPVGGFTTETRVDWPILDDQSEPFRPIHHTDCDVESS